MARASRTLVVKIGSSTLIDKKGRLDRQYLHNLARQLEELREMGWAPIVVSSGAIAVGSKIERAKLDVDLPAGTYECTAYFHNLDPDSGAIIGTAGAIINITIQN